MISYTAICSLDGYIEDESGSFEWAEPDPEVHQLANDLDREVDIHLYGRRLYEVMRYWESIPPESPAVEQDYSAVWRDSDKIVVSHSDVDIITERTTVWSDLDADRIRALPGNVGVGGADIAGQVLRLGLVDEVRLLVNPVIVGGGKRALPDGIRFDLELLEERRFASGVVYLRYAVTD